MMKTMLWVWLGLSMGFGLTGPVWGQPAAQETAGTGNDRSGVKVLQERADRLIAQLPNGLIVVVQETHVAPVVSVQAWIKTGSIYEQEHVGAGLSHFLEHLISGGTTKNRTEAENNKILGAIGAQTNAATGLDTVHYYINTTSQHVAQAIELLSDQMQNCLVTPAEFAREREVIRNEFSMGEGEPGRILWKLTQQARYLAHPARHPTIGYLDEFNRITRDQIYDFYKRMYVPNNVVFVVAGDVNKADVLQQVTTLWKDAPAGKLPSLSFPVEPEIDGAREMSGTADVRRPRLRLAWPGTQVGEEGDYALDLLARVLGGGEASRLVESVRDKQQRVTTITAYNLSFAWGKGFFGIDAEVAEMSRPGEAGGPDEAIRQAKAAILAEVAKVAQQGVTEEELARAKRQTIAAVVMAAQTADDQAEMLAQNLIAYGDPDYLTYYSQAVARITPAELQQAARKFLTDQRLITVTLRPRPAGQPVTPLTRPADAPGADKLPRVPVDLDNSLVVKRLAALQAQARTAAAPVVMPLTLHTLPNGLRVLIGRDTSLPMVTMQFYHLGGLLADQPGRQGLANATAVMMMRGAGNLTAPQLARAVNDLGASLTVECGNNTWYSRATCLREDWKRLLELQAMVIRQPTFPDAEWARVQPRLLAAIDRQGDTWAGELRTAFLKTYFGDHLWSTSPLGVRAVVAQLTPEDLKKFHREHLGADQSVLAILGDVEPAEVLAEVTRWYGTLPARAEAAWQPQPAKPAEARTVEVETRKPLAAVMIGYGPGVARTSPDYARLAVADKVLSSFPSGWLESALRGDGQGLVYAVGAYQVAGAVPGYLAVMFNTQPTQLAEALQRAQATVTRLREELVGAEDLNRAKTAVLVAEFLGKQTLADRAAEAALNTLYGLGLEEPTRFQETVTKLTAEELRVVAQTYLRNPVIVILKPLGNTSAPAFGNVPGSAPEK